MRMPDALKKYRSEIDSELKSIFAEHRLPLYDMMKYHLGWTDDKGKPILNPQKGKALRPILCLLACEAVGGSYKKALPAAAALELVHNFSLIHDDIQDGDTERRHRPTVWSIWGKPQAINAGTAMRSLANLALERLKTKGFSASRCLLAHRILEDSSLRLIEGQYLDISYETRIDITVDDYLKMIEGKTAALIACSVELGAILGTTKQPVIDCFRRFGKNLGIAFQIMDDILGIWGDESKTGKPSGNDIRRKKKTFPIVYALQTATGNIRKKLVDIYKKNTLDEKHVTAVLGHLEFLQARECAQKTAISYRDKALGAFKKVSLASSALKELMRLANFLVDREF
jgi:geranylgeranyl diphosphate synthase type I